MLLKVFNQKKCFLIKLDFKICFFFLILFYKYETSRSSKTPFGLLVNGPRLLIKGNSCVLPVVTAIINGIGSMGATLDPLLAGYIFTRGWNNYCFFFLCKFVRDSCGKNWDYKETIWEKIAFKLQIVHWWRIPGGIIYLCIFCILLENWFLKEKHIKVQKFLKVIIHCMYFY